MNYTKKQLDEDAKKYLELEKQIEELKKELEEVKESIKKGIVENEDEEANKKGHKYFATWIVGNRVVLDTPKIKKELGDKLPNFQKNSITHSLKVGVTQ